MTSKVVTHVRGNRWADHETLGRTATLAREAHTAVAQAEAERARAVLAALAAGHSTRSLAPMLSVAHNTIARWARSASAEEGRDAR